MGKNYSKSYMKDALIKLGLAGMLAFQTIAPSVLTVVRAEDGSEGSGSTTEVVAAPESVEAAAPEELPVEEVYVPEELPVVEETVNEELVSEEESSIEGESSVEPIVEEEISSVPSESEPTDETIPEEKVPTQMVETIQVSLYELITNPEGITKTTSDGKVAVDIYSHQYGSGTRNERFAFQIYGNVASLISVDNAIIDNNNFQMSATLDNHGNIISESAGHFSYQTSEGDRVDYNIQFDVVGSFEVEQISVDVVPENGIANYSSSDGNITFKVDNDQLYLDYLVNNEDWIIYNHRTDTLDTRYNTFNYHSIVYSSATQAVKLYQVIANNSFKVNDTLSQEKLNLSLNKNMRYEIGTEKYVNSTEFDGISFVGSYDNNNETYRIDLQRTKDSSLFSMANGNFEFTLDESQDEKIVYIEHREYNEKLSKYEVTDRIQMTLNFDNEEADAELEPLEFYKTVNFNDVQLTSDLLSLPEFDIEFNENRQEKYYLGYDASGVYSDYAGYSTEGTYILFKFNEEQQYPEFYTVLYSHLDGTLETWIGYNNKLIFTVEGVPVNEPETVNISLDFSNTKGNKLSLPLEYLTVEAYYHGRRSRMYEFSFNTPSDSEHSVNVSSVYRYDYEESEMQEVIVYSNYTGRIIAKYNINFEVEKNSIIGTDDDSYAITDEEIDFKKQETILLTSADLKNSSKNNELIKEIDNTFYVDIDFTSSSYGDRNELLSYYAYLSNNLIWAKDSSEGSIVLFGNSNYWGLSSSRDSNGDVYFGTQVIYYRSAEGVITEYELTLVIDDIPTPEIVDIDFSEETDGNIVQTSNRKLDIAIDYEKRLLLLKPASGWSIIEKQIEIDTRYNQYNHYVHLYSETGELRVYALSVRPTISESNMIEVNLSLNKNSQLAFGTEVYEKVTELGESIVYGYYEPGQEKYYIEFKGDYEYFNTWKSFTFVASDTNETHTALLEEKVYDYYTNTYRIGKTIKINVNTDNETEINNDLTLDFNVSIPYQELVIESLTDTPYELELEYNSMRKESILLAYDNVGLFKDNYGHSTKDKFVQVYNNDGINYLSGILYETYPGMVTAYGSHGSLVNITIENMPEIFKEILEIPVTLEHDVDNPLVVYSNTFPNMFFSAYHNHSDEHWYNHYSLEYPEYHYDGVYSFYENFDWNFSVQDDIEKEVRTINITRVGEGNRLIGQIELHYTFEKPDGKERETISFELVQKNANNYFAKQTSVSSDGLVYLSSSYEDYKEPLISDEYHMNYFAVLGNITPKAKEEGYMLVSSVYLTEVFKEKSSMDEFEITHPTSYVLIKHVDSDEIYKYPVNVSVNSSMGEDESEISIFEFSGNATEFMQIKSTEMGTSFGKEIEIEISEYETIPGNIFLDKENFFEQFTESTPPEDRFLIFLYGSYGIPHISVKLDDYTFEANFDDIAKVIVNILDPDQTVIEAQDFQVSGDDLVEGKLNLSGGDVTSLVATIKPLNATNQAITWTSSNPEVANVLNGDVYAITSGQTTITAETHNGLTVSIEVEVTNDAPVADVEVELEQDGDIDIDDENYRPAVKVKGASTAIPKGAVIRVEPIKEEAVAYKQMNELTAGRMMMYDIKLFNKQAGINVQPNAPLMVSIEIPTGYDTSKIKMYYFDEKTGVRQEMPGYVDGNYYTFEVTHFSYYVLVEEEPTAPEPVIEEKTSEKTEVIPFEIIRQENDELTVGTERLVVKGVDGVKTLIFKDIYQDGELISTTQINENITTKPIDEVIEYGTKPIELESEPIEESSEESESSDETSSDEDSSSDEENSDETSSEDEPGKDDETPEESIELTIEVNHEWMGVSLNGQATGLNGQFTSESITVKDGEEFTVKALTASDVNLDAIEGAHEFIAPKDQNVKASADQTTITMLYQVVQKNSEEQVTALEDMLAKAKATIASIEAKEVVAKSIFNGWIRSVSAQTVTFDEAQAAVITQVQVLSAYLSTIEQGGYIPASSIDQSLVTTQTAIDTLVAVGQEKDQPAKESPVKEVTKGKTKEGQLPNTGEDTAIWVRILAFVLLAFGVVVLFKGKKRRNI